MIEISRRIKVRLLKSGELSCEERIILEYATIVRKRAIAPYSHFLVGAAILWENGEMSTGFNIENCIFNVLHAEKAAISNGLSLYGVQRVKAIAVIGEPENAKNISPEELSSSDWEGRAKKIRIKQCCVSCGQCLQDILEYSFGEEGSVQMFMTIGGVVVKTTLDDLLPARFGPHDIGVDLRKLKSGE